MAREVTTPPLYGQVTDTVSNYQKKLNKREQKVVEAALYNEFLDDDFSSALIVSNFDNADGTIYTGAAGEEMGFHSGRAAYEMHIAAAATPAVIAPFQSAQGLELKPVAAADALEITNGTTALSPQAYVVGSFNGAGTKEIFFKTEIDFGDISDISELAVGWRKAEDYQAAVDSYDEMAAFNMGGQADGRLDIETIINNAATVTTDTTVTDIVDDGVHTFEIRVTNGGVVSFLYDNATPTITKAFTFDAGEVIIPFLFLDTETGDPAVSVTYWKVGYR